MPVRVLLLPPDPPEALVRAAAPEGCDVEVVRLPEHTVAALRAALPAVDVVVGDWSGRLRLDGPEAALATGPGARGVRLVQQPTTGVDPIDVSAWAARGVPVANTGSANARSVAEWCLGATMNLLRSYRWSDAQVRDGRWPQVSILEEAAPRELAGSRVGLVGAGGVARLCARMYAALGCEVAYWSPRSRIEDTTYAELPDLFAASDIVIVAIARVPGTIGLVSRELVDRMPVGAVLVDVSRGGIVDQVAVVSRLASRALGGAALDVYATEPPQLDPDWVASEHVLLSPHVAGVTTDAMARAYAAVEENVRALCEGRPLVHVVDRPQHGADSADGPR